MMGVVTNVAMLPHVLLSFSALEQIMYTTQYVLINELELEKNTELASIC